MGSDKIACPYCQTKYTWNWEQDILEGTEMVGGNIEGMEVTIYRCKKDNAAVGVFVCDDNGGSLYQAVDEGE